MSPVKSAKGVFAPNDQAQQQKQDDSKKKTAMKKVYIHRNSPLTDMMEGKNFRSLSNICLAACFFVFLYMLAFYLTEPPMFWKDMYRMKLEVSKFPNFVIFCLLFHLIAFAFFEGFKLWVVVRNRIQPKVADYFFLLLYITSLVLTFAVSAYYMFKVQLFLLFGCIVGVEQVRIYMKIHSFVREKAPCVIQYKPKQDEREQEALYPTRKHFLYYLFAPVLIYRDNYPRTENRDWGNVFSNLCRFCLCLFLFFCILMRFYGTVFENVGIQLFTKKEVVLISVGCTVFGSMIKFLGFYSLLHCWLNAFAEGLKFGDREFYKDWWNSASFGQYFRTWNTVVHDWLHTYIYEDSQRLGCGVFLGRAIVFMVSSLCHEYIFSTSLQFFYPVFFVMYVAVGVLFVEITKYQLFRQHFNIFLWITFFTSSYVLGLLFTLEWYARLNCPKKETYIDFFVPRSWDPSCQIIAQF